MAEYREEEFLTLYPGVYTEGEKEAVEEYFRECKAIHDRGPIDVQKLVAGELPENTPGVEKMFPVPEALVKYQNDRIDPENRVINDPEYARSLGYDNNFALLTFAPHTNVDKAFPPFARDTILANQLNGNITSLAPIYPGDTLYLVIDDREMRDITPCEGSTHRYLAISGKASTYKQTGEKVNEMAWNICEGIRIFKEDRRPKPRSEMGFMDCWEGPAWLKREQHHYTDKDWEFIIKTWENEKHQGSEKLYWEDVKVGTEPAPTLDGPVYTGPQPHESSGHGKGGSRNLKSFMLGKDYKESMDRDPLTGIYTPKDMAAFIPAFPNLGEDKTDERGENFSEAEIEELGVEILLGTRATRLILKDGKITGVLAEDEAGELSLSCKACLIATGNMACSPEISRFAPEYGRAAHNRNAHRLPSATGDGVRLAEEAGLPIDEQGVACHFLGAMPSFFDGDVLQQGLRCEGIRVNMYGKRFVNECVDRFEAVTLVAKQPECLTYNVIDSRILRQEILPTIKLPTDIGGNLQRGVPMPGKPLPMVDFMGFPIPLDENGKPIRSKLLDAGDQSKLGQGKQKDVPEKLKEYVSLKGHQVCVADTLEELAEQMGVPADALCSTVARYNEMCHKGRDDDFGKYPNYMFPVEHAPYIAIKCYLGSDGAFGGIFIDDHCRVKGKDGIVKGLYATGDVTSGNFIKERYSRIEIINDFTRANASGFLAAEDIKKYLG